MISPVMRDAMRRAGEKVDEEVALSAGESCPHCGQTYECATGVWFEKIKVGDWFTPLDTNQPSKKVGAKKTIRFGYEDSNYVDMWLVQMDNVQVAKISPPTNLVPIAEKFGSAATTKPQKILKNGKNGLPELRK